jgi:hypothetical protein
MREYYFERPPYIRRGRVMLIFLSLTLCMIVAIQRAQMPADRPSFRWLSLPTGRYFR